jgi:hypothetical protein
MTTIHLSIAIALAVSVSLTLLASIPGLFGRYLAHAVDRLLLLDFAVLAVMTLSGPPLLLTGLQPPDALHFVYAGVAWVLLPVARYLARVGTPRRRGAIMVGGCLATLAVVARLFMTGL